MTARADTIEDRLLRSRSWVGLRSGSVPGIAPSLKPAVRRAPVCESIERMELGVHLPLMEFGDEGQSLGRLRATVDAAGQSGFVAVSANALSRCRPRFLPDRRA